MDSKYVSVGLSISCMLWLILVGLVSSDISKDREECADKLVGLATCLPYVGGEAKSPTPECCSGLKLVVEKSKKCLCILVKDRNDPSLGLKINTTLALTLPTICHSPTNVSDCPNLLHLAPNSPDAKVFQEFANITANGSNSAPATTGNFSSNGSTADINSDGGKGKRWLGIEMACAVLITVVLQYYPILDVQ